MESQRFGSHYVLRLDSGEEVMATLLDFIRREQIRGGYFLAFGGFSQVRLRYFSVAQEAYQDFDINQQVEVVSLLGNIAEKNGEPMIHMHTSVSDSSGRTFSGHIGSGTVRPTLEVFVSQLDGALRLQHDPETGLDLLSLGPIPTRL
jgi:hypothetical protein